jgi:uncharacterized protein (TIGR02145 family)
MINSNHYSLLTVLKFKIYLVVKHTGIILIISLAAPLSGGAQTYDMRYNRSGFNQKYPDNLCVLEGAVSLYLVHIYEEPKAPMDFNTGSAGLDLALTIVDMIDFPHHDEYYAEVDGFFEKIGIIKSTFHKQVGNWFHDDPSFIQHIKRNKIKPEIFPYLIYLYNKRKYQPSGIIEFNDSLPRLSEDALVDERDGQLYNILINGTQYWMAENLRFEFDSVNSYRNPDINEVYYTWKTAHQICPEGWRLPTEIDWNILLLSLGMPLADAGKIFGFDKKGILAKRLLAKYTRDGFNVREVGYLNKFNKMEDNGAFFWSYELENEKSSKAISISKRTEHIFFNKNNKLSVRCVSYNGN